MNTDLVLGNPDDHLPEDQRLRLAFAARYPAWGGSNSDPRFNAFAAGWQAAQDDTVAQGKALRLRLHGERRKADRRGD